MSINRQEFTTVGRDMLGRANAGETLTIATVVVGETRVTAPADLWPLTEIPGYVMDVTITQQTDLGDGVLLIDASFNSSQAPRAFELCGVGVMAHIANEPDRLYSVANVLATGADNVDPVVESIHAFKIKVVIDRAPNVTVVIGTSQDIMGENIGAATVGAGVFAEKLANTLRFKRLVMGPAIEINEDDETITIGQKTLLINLDLYVPLSHPLGTPETRFATLQEAHTYLLGYTIPSDITARINIQAGTMDPSVLGTGVEFTHPNAASIQILGDPTVVMKTISSGSIVPGGPNIYNVTVGVNDVANLAVGDLVNLFGVDVLELNGCWIINNIAGLNVTLTVYAYRSEITGNPTTGTLTKYLSQLVSVGGALAIHIVSNQGIGLIQNLAFIGDMTTEASGLAFAGGGTANIVNVDIARFDHGLNSIGPFLFYPDHLCCCGGGQDGFRATNNPTFNINGDCAFSGNSGNGFVIYHAYVGAIAPAPFYVCGNNFAGISISFHTSCVILNQIIARRNFYGIFGTGKSYFRAAAGNISLNGVTAGQGADLQCEGGSYLDCRGPNPEDPGVGGIVLTIPPTNGVMDPNDGSFVAY
jgi:hypothetical protein